MTDQLLTMADVADRQRFTGRDRERSAKRLIRRNGIPHVERGRTWLLTESQYELLLETMTSCSPYESAAKSITAAARSVSGGTSAKSKSTLQAAVNARLRKPTKPSSSTKSAKNSFTVVTGGRKA
jgi:hypothetical protein